jgi:hypothetical protein
MVELMGNDKSRMAIIGCDDILIILFGKTSFKSYISFVLFFYVESDEKWLVFIHFHPFKFVTETEDLLRNIDTIEILHKNLERHRKNSVIGYF